jgi:hypothetical protein
MSDGKREHLIGLLDNSLRHNMPCGDMTDIEYWVKARKIINDTIDHYEAATVEARFRNP